MIRVVQVSFHMDRLGRTPEALLAAWPTLRATAEAAALRGAEVTVVQPMHRDAGLGLDGVEYRFVRERPAWRPGHGETRSVRVRAPRVAAAVRAAHPDLVHVHGLSLPRHARRLRRGLDGVPVLGQDHADKPSRGPAARLVRWARTVGSIGRSPRSSRRALPSTVGAPDPPWDAVLFTAREQAAPFLEVGALRPDVPVHEVLEASTSFRPGDPGAARRTTGIHGDPALLWLGRLDVNKDPLTVLEGVARAVPRLPDAHLWCCFRAAPLLGPVRARIEADPALRGRVHLLGERPPAVVERLLQGADALVQGSHREGSGYAVLEALACGATPVVTDIPSFRRIVGAEREHRPASAWEGAGLLWPPGDAAALARALEALARRDSASRRAAARARFESALSPEALGRELASAYEAVLADRPCSSRWSRPGASAPDPRSSGDPVGGAP